MIWAGGKFAAASYDLDTGQVLPHNIANIEYLILYLV